MKDKKHSKKERDSSSSHTSELPLLLNWALLNFPQQFLEDFPQMIGAIDAGESVNVDAISDTKYRAILNQVMHCLPLEHSYEFGYFRKETTKPIGGSVLKQLLDGRSIQQPMELSSSERLSSQQAPLIILNLLTSFPALKGDLQGLLSNVRGGNAVQLENIENDDIREGLERLFKCIELVYSPRSGCYEIPEGRKGYLIEDTLDHILAVFDAEAKYDKKFQKQHHHHHSSSSSDKKKKSKSSKQSSSSGRGSDSDGESDSGDDYSGSPSASASSDSEDTSVNNDIVIASFSNNLRSSDTLSEQGGQGEEEEAGAEIGPQMPPPRVGPTMPTAAELSEAQRLSSAAMNEEAEESDDDFGPQLYDPVAERQRLAQSRPTAANSLSRLQQQPLGLMESTIEDIQAQESNRYYQKYGEYVEQDAEAAAKKAAAATVREEWILDPGSNRLVSEMNGAGTTNRKFQSGKVAKRTAAQMAAAREAAADEPDSEEAQQTAAILAEYREKRGLTLMEQHLAKSGGASSSSSGGGGGGGAGGGVKRKAWDRDEEMASFKKMDRQQVGKLVDNARELDSRFDKGSVQKSFL